MKSPAAPYPFVGGGGGPLGRKLFAPATWRRSIGGFQLIFGASLSVALVAGSFAPPPLAPPPLATSQEAFSFAQCASCKNFCAAVRSKVASGRQHQRQVLLAEARWRGCALACKQEKNCPVGIERLPPTPYPPPPPPPVPAPLWAGDLRAAGKPLLPTPTPPAGPAPPLPPLPVVPIPNFFDAPERGGMGVGLRFLPRIELPKQEVMYDGKHRGAIDEVKKAHEPPEGVLGQNEDYLDEKFDLDYNGNPVTKVPPPLPAPAPAPAASASLLESSSPSSIIVSQHRTVGFGEEAEE